VPVAVYEAARPGAGQSAAESRLFRHAHDDIRLVEFARRGREAWREWEARFELELISGDGALALGDSALERLAVLDQAGGFEAHEVDSDEVAQRLPLLGDYDGPAMFDPQAGAIRTTAAIAALSSELEASLRTEVGEVLAVEPTGDGVQVRTVGSVAHHSRVVVCAGRGTPALAAEVGLELPVETSRHVRLKFGVREPGDMSLACLQDSSGAWGEEGIYAAPLPGGKRYAVGLSETTRDGELPELAERAAAYVERALPGLDPEPLGHLHCWVTTVPWSDDGLAAWDHEGIVFVAGHNLFKQAPELGRMLAAAALGGELDPLLAPEAKLGSDAPPSH
jgi:sarcosine oxidase